MMAGSQDGMAEAYVTMVTSDSYVVGAIVLANSLQSASLATDKRPFICMVTPEVSLFSLPHELSAQIVHVTGEIKMPLSPGRCR